ncbi:DUF6908 domain-containing protein [Leptospira kmetyi]|uniref:DUF6908 domain-containing protein n=1 Tax=Leptospira kmetyi TaxID=408139 RepID=A0ABX4N6C5_9LEPT|nr:hypothetical protein [Leptospira kmetyi]PJZ28735.1 hypothetical protein CH378_16170 [Leptospira kmetyi]PJZ39559.1 hypothetical protein CH370_21145 [Leptospira kmetyi]
MKNVLKLIEENGGLDQLKNRALRVKSEGFMDLVIEFIGPGPQGKDAVSVAHYYIQEGDMMRDPEVCFELIEEYGLKKVKGINIVHKELKMVPYLFVQDGHRGRYDEVYLLRDDGSIKAVSYRLQKSIQSFCNSWNRNLKDQKFFDPMFAQIEVIE